MAINVERIASDVVRLQVEDGEHLMVIRTNPEEWVVQIVRVTPDGGTSTSAIGTFSHPDSAVETAKEYLEGGKDLDKALRDHGLETGK